jgi:argininosuccinate lyase
MSKAKPVSRSGRFSSGPSAEVEEFGESVSFDYRLWQYDILGSMAHARMLQKIGILTQSELDAILSTLEQIGEEINEGIFHWDDSLEDVHMNIEAELTRRQPAGAKLHTGRSRNDQIALDMRMWLRDQISDLHLELARLQQSMVDLAKANDRVVIPGYTHLQRAQPVFLAHHLLAYVEMFDRDDSRLIDCFQRVNVCPLGSGALAGSTLPLDREFVARELQFVDRQGKPIVTRNSMDAISDRDYVVEFCSVAALIAMHISRLAEDLILWSSSEFNFIRISDGFTTGSSLMPQKKNPDVAEIARGKTGRVVGNLMSLLVLLKGLPMTYNRDLQEDKERLFDTVDTVRRTVRIFSAMMPEITVNAKVCRHAASDPLLLATDLADHLVLKGVPFRDSHHIVGAVVALAEKLGKPISDLTVSELKSVDPRFDVSSRRIFKLEKSLSSRTMTGAPSPESVAGEISRWNELLAHRIQSAS